MSSTARPLCAEQSEHLRQDKIRVYKLYYTVDVYEYIYIYIHTVTKTIVSHQLINGSVSEGWEPPKCILRISPGK